MYVKSCVAAIALRDYKFVKESTIQPRHYRHLARQRRERQQDAAPRRRHDSGGEAVPGRGRDTAQGGRPHAGGARPPQDCE